MFNIIVNGKGTLVTSEYNVTSQIPAFMYNKRGRPRQGGEKVAIGQFGDSFLGQIDREAVTRMSGQCWMNPIS